MQVVSRRYGSSVSIGRTYSLLGNRVAMPVVQAVAVVHAMAENVIAALRGHEPRR